MRFVHVLWTRDAGRAGAHPYHPTAPATRPLIDQRDAGCPAACHVESQGLSDAAGRSGDHRDLSFNRVHIDGSAGRRLKGTNFVRLEARLFDGSGDNGVQMLLLQAPRPVVSPSFAFASPFFAIALKVFD